jgi:hypothetical protein
VYLGTHIYNDIETRNFAACKESVRNISQKGQWILIEHKHGFVICIDWDETCIGVYNPNGDEFCLSQEIDDAAEVSNTSNYEFINN